MKTTIKVLILPAMCIALLVPAAVAQYKATGDDGITASPKYRQVLNENKAVKPVAAISKMACPKCKDKLVTKTDDSARGANKPAITVATHLCKGCGTEWTVVGHGKAKESVATHKCNSCGADSVSCCKKS